MMDKEAKDMLFAILTVLKNRRNEIENSIQCLPAEAKLLIEELHTMKHELDHYVPALVCFLEEANQPQADDWRIILDRHFDRCSGRILRG